MGPFGVAGYFRDRLLLHLNDFAAVTRSGYTTERTAGKACLPERGFQSG